jgi:hypothetical protein
MALACAPSKTSIIVKTVMDDKFEDIFSFNEDAIRLVDDGRACETAKRGSIGCSLGIHSYSSGVHRIRIKVHYGSVFLGIRSRNILPVTNEYVWGRYDTNPSTYG